MELARLINQISGPNFQGFEALAKTMLYQTMVLERSLSDIGTSIDQLTKAINEKY